MSSPYVARRAYTSAASKIDHAASTEYLNKWKGMV